MQSAVALRDAALRIVRWLRKRRCEIAFPWQLVAPVQRARPMPCPMLFW
jgi:hypothetical protein